jgi:hypothetical protein
VSSKQHRVRTSSHQRAGVTACGSALTSACGSTLRRARQFMLRLGAWKANGRRVSGGALTSAGSQAGVRRTPSGTLGQGAACQQDCSHLRGLFIVGPPWACVPLSCASCWCRLLSTLLHCLSRSSCADRLRGVGKPREQRSERQSARRGAALWARTCLAGPQGPR